MQLYLDCCCWAKKAFSITFHSSIFGSGQFLLCSIVHWMLYYWTRASTAKWFWKQTKKSGKMSKMVLYANGFLGKFGYYCTLMYAREHNLSLELTLKINLSVRQNDEWWLFCTQKLFSAKKLLLKSYRVVKGRRDGVQLLLRQEQPTPLITIEKTFATCFGLNRL